jgi:tetratricopeptide (TPR) repeat protein
MVSASKFVVAVVFGWALSLGTSPVMAKPTKAPKRTTAVKDKAKPAKASAEEGPAASDPAANLRRKAAEPGVPVGRVISLLRGATALSTNPRLIEDLAAAYQRAGQLDLASHELRRYASVVTDRERAEAARAKARDIDEQPRGFNEGGFRTIPATAEAAWAFSEGQRRAKAKKYREAIPYFQAALMLDPSAPGPYRLLGVIYGKVGDKAKESQFLIEYLRVRPDGGIADTVRKILAKNNALGYLTLESSYPCDVTINGRELAATLTPIRKLPMPPGGYSISLGSDAMHGQWNIRDRVEVVAGREAVFKLPLGLLSVKTVPWARVSVDGKYVGAYPELGLRAGSYRVHLESADGAQQKDVNVSIQAGRRFVIDKW